jgi:hypothetical protein
LKDLLTNNKPDPMQVTINNPAPVQPVQSTQPAGPLFTADGVTFKMPEQVAPVVNVDTEKLAEVISSNMGKVIQDAIASMPATVVNVPAPIVQVKENKPDETNTVWKAMRKLVNGRKD